MSLDQELLKKFNNKISNNISLTNYSWFNLGGPAEYLFKPENINQLKEFIRYNKKINLKLQYWEQGQILSSEIEELKE